MRTSNVRPTTCRLMEMMDEGVLSPRAVADACLGYLSEDDVADMAKQYQLIEDEDEEQDDEEAESDEE